MFDKVKEKMPWFKESVHIIQHDGAKPHTGNGNMGRFKAAGCADSWHMKVKTQTAQSPALNALDLGFFNSLKRTVDITKFKANNIDELIMKVAQAYQMYSAHTLNSIWNAQVPTLSAILKVKGDNV